MKKPTSRGFGGQSKEAWNAIASGWHVKLSDLDKEDFERLTAAETRQRVGRALPSLWTNYYHLNGKPMLREDGKQLGRARMYGGSQDERYCGGSGGPVAFFMHRYKLLRLLKKFPKRPIQFVEGENKARYLVELGIPAVGYQGVSA